MTGEIPPAATTQGVSLVFDFGSREAAESALQQIEFAMDQAGLFMFFSQIVAREEGDYAADA